MTIYSILPQLQRAQDLHQSGRTDEAWTILLPLRKAIDNHGEALRLFALVAKSAGDFYEAAQALLRIASIENEPPDIIVALADLLSTAGKYDDSLKLWDSLVQKYPLFADAHLNRTVTAINAGKHDLALAAADEGLRLFPNHVPLIAAKATALKNVSRIVESVQLFEVAVAAEPNRAVTRSNQALALRAACRYEEACEAFAAAERLGMKGAQFHANWAAAALEAGRVEEAAQLYEQALRENPGHRESLKGLTRLDIEYRDAERAFEHYERSLEARAQSAEAWLDWSDALMNHYRTEEAADVLVRARAIHPGHMKIRTLASFLKGMAGDPNPALDQLEEDLNRDPGNVDILGSIQILAIRAKRFERAAEILEPWAVRDRTNQVPWSLLAIVWRMLGDEREHWLCDYERLVMVCDVPSPDRSLSPVDYAAAVAAVLDPLHQSLRAPGDQTLRGGTQTSGNLFDRPEPEIELFKQAVLEAAHLCLAELPDDPEHPFLARKSSRLGFSGSWSIRLGHSGHHVPHYHSMGWMSSAYYARLPPSTQAARDRHEGWIQFGVPPENFGLDLEPRRIVEPRPGRLVLFPSYLWHGTIPFQTGDRLTAAFDYVPL